VVGEWGEQGRSVVGHHLTTTFVSRELYQMTLGTMLILYEFIVIFYRLSIHNTLRRSWPNASNRHNNWPLLPPLLLLLLPITETDDALADFESLGADSLS
jgi:hypothetical protein